MSRFRLLAFALGAATLAAAQSSGPPKGTLLLDGGGATEPVVREFRNRGGGPDARIVAFPTGASSLRFGRDNVVLDPDWPRDRPEWTAYQNYLRQWFGTEHVTILHTRDRAAADSEDFVRPLRQATGVFLSSGNAGRYAAAYLGTRTQKELEALLARGGIVFGSSAGAIIQGSFVVRGQPDKPLLIALRPHPRLRLPRTTGSFLATALTCPPGRKRLDPCGAGRRFGPPGACPHEVQQDAPYEAMKKMGAIGKRLSVP